MQQLSRTQSQFYLISRKRLAILYTDLAWRYAILCILIYALYISISLLPGARSNSILAGDSLTYFIPAQNLAQYGLFSREPGAPYLWEPYRTPGYPIIIAFTIICFGEYRLALFLAALSAGLAGWSAVRLVQLWGGGRLAQHLAGLAVLALPNSLGLSAFLLTDAIFGHLTLMWIYALIRGWTYGSWRALLGSAFILSILQALKPTMNAGMLILFLVAVLYVRQRRQLLSLLILVALSLPLPLYFSFRNAADNGVFQPTLLGVETVREYLQSRYLAEQNGIDYTSMTERIRAEDRAAATLRTQPPSMYGRLYQVKQEQVTKFIHEAPLSAARLMITEAARQLIAPQEFAALVFRDTLPVWIRILGSLLTIALWLSAGYGGWRLYGLGNRQPIALVIGVLLFFLASGAVSTLVGARLRFPADMVALPLAAFGAAQILPFLPVRVCND